MQGCDQLMGLVKAVLCQLFEEIMGSASSTGAKSN